MDGVLKFGYICFLLSLTCLFIPSFSIPCISEPSCDCVNNERTVHCESKMGVGKLQNFHPDVVSLTIRNSFLGPMLNTSFSSFMMEVEEIILTHCRIHTITDVVFRYLRNLRKLVLTDNYLRILNFDVFSHLTSLEELDLSHNRFSVLPDGAFRTLTNLRYFNISYNNLTDIKLGLRFQVMEQMQVLDFSGNSFQNIPSDAFEMSSSWRSTVPKVMNLSYCGIKFINESAFQNPQGIEMLDLSGNFDISYTNLTYFFNSSDSPNIKYLDLSSIGLTNVTELFSTFRRRNIKELLLSNNNITEVPPELSENSAGTLTKLDLSKNKLTSISQPLSELKSLLYLDLSNNRISDVDPKFDANLVNLDHLDLSYNEIGDGKITLQNFENIKWLDFSHNKLVSFSLPDSLQNLQFVNLSYNSIASLDTLNALHKLETFLFENNELIELNEFLFVDSPNINSVNFKGNKIKTLADSTFEPYSPKYIDLSFNKLETIRFPGWKNVKSISLRGNGMNSLNKATFYALFQLVFLDLAENNLIFLEDKLFLYFTNLTTLHLEHNQLYRSDNWDELFQNLILLKKMDLSFNNISKFYSSDFVKSELLEELCVSHNRIHHVEPSGLRKLTNIKNLDFSVNPFVCNCYARDFRDWLCSSGVKMSYSKENYTCLSPEEQHGKDFCEFKLGHFECDFLYLYMVVYSIVGAIFLIVIITTAFVCHFHLKWRRNQLIVKSRPSIDFESMEHSPFIPDDTLDKKSKQSKKKDNEKIKAISNHKVGSKNKKKKSKMMDEVYTMNMMNGYGNFMNGDIKEVSNAKKTKKSPKSKAVKKGEKKRRHSDSGYVFKHRNELIVQKPRRKTNSELETNPYVQQFLWQQHKKHMKNLVNKQLNRESFRNVDVIRPKPILSSRSESVPDVKYYTINRMPRSNTAGYRLNEYYPDMGTWHGSRSRQNIGFKDQYKMSGYNTIGGTLKSHAQYI